jgi:hypothetical protein
MKRRFLIASLAVAALTSVLVIADHPARAGSDTSIDSKIAAAKTPGDHEAIAAYYDKQAARAQAKADQHHKMAAAYKKLGGAVIEKMHVDQHCDALAASYEGIVKESKALAEAHRAMAKEAKH